MSGVSCADSVGCGDGEMWVDWRKLDGIHFTLINVACNFKVLNVHTLCIRHGASRGMDLNI